MDFSLPPSKQILLTVGDNGGRNGQQGLTHFRNWGKYFNSYSIDIFSETLINNYLLKQDGTPDKRYKHNR